MKTRMKIQRCQKKLQLRQHLQPLLQLRRPQQLHKNLLIYVFIVKTLTRTKDPLGLNTMVINRKTIIRQCQHTVFISGSPLGLEKVSKRPEINIQSSETTVNVSDIFNNIISQQFNFLRGWGKVVKILFYCSILNIFLNDCIISQEYCVKISCWSEQNWRNYEYVIWAFVAPGRVFIQVYELRISRARL